MLITRPWKSLKVSSEGQLLFLKAHMSEARCSFEITDLSRLWGVNLSREELVQSTRRQATSIDPSEDEQQYDQFLSRINSALDGEAQTNLSLERCDSHGLNLGITVPLPGSLPTLKWTVKLLQVDSDQSTSLEADIVAPLLIHTTTLKAQIQYLLDQLGHKDRVIAKLADKLENIGQDLTQVFPGASHIRFHKKAPKRVQLASHVDGLAPLDSSSWQNEASKAADESKPSLATINAILADLPESQLLELRETGLDGRPHPYDGDVEAHVGSLNEGNQHRAGASGVRIRMDMSEAEPVQVLSIQEDKLLDHTLDQQVSSPAKPGPAADLGLDTDEETEDEDALDVPKSKASPVTSSRHKPSDNDSTGPHEDVEKGSPNHGIDGATTSLEAGPDGKRKLGAFGGRKGTQGAESHTSRDSTSAPSKVQSNTRQLGRFGGPRKPTTLDPHSAESAHHSLEATPKRGSRLGAFGGAAASGTQASPVKRGTRLGVFGGASQAAATSDEVEDDVDSPGAQREPDGVTLDQDRRGREDERGQGSDAAQEREDSQERADEKRRRLKREMAAKAKEAVKKKRKF